MRRLVVALALVLAAVTMAGPALAYGGFFYQNQPIDQSGEKVLFVKDGQSVTAYVQIHYTGEARSFGWVVPVPSRPTLTTSSDEIFTRLEPVTQVRYQLNLSQTEGKCKDSGLLAMPTSNAVGMAAPKSAEDAVHVVQQDRVGPYDSAILQADTVDTLKTWLKDNQYTVPDRFDEVVKAYTKPNQYYVALKLRQDRGTGDLAPIVLSYANSDPCIPLILTSIAARADMPITAYVLGPSRAVPTNYRHVQVNEALVDWQANGSNYNALVSLAVNEAGGRAFVTDIATESRVLRSALQNRYDLAGFDGLLSAWSVIQEAQRQGFPQSSQLLGIIRRTLLAAGSAAALDDNLLSKVYAYQRTLERRPVSLDALSAFKSELDAVFVTPMRSLYDEFGRVPYLTRFYTTMSPDEMTVDPVLEFNPLLPPVSNIHTAEATVLCDSYLPPYQAPLRIKLADGVAFFVARNQTIVIPNMPVALNVMQLDTETLGKFISDNQDAINALLNTFATAQAAFDATQKATGLHPGCGCLAPSMASNPFSGSEEAAVYGVAYVGLAGYVRRRRRKDP